MLILGWITYGVLVSFGTFAFYPHQTPGNPISLIMLVVFTVLGGLDYLASVVEKKTGRSRLRLR